MRSAIVAKALAWVGQNYKPGVVAQCAAFVSYLLAAVGFSSALWPAAKWHQEQGYTWAPWEPTAWTPNYSGTDNRRPMGERITFGDLTAGDIVIFGNTYMVGTSTHIGIYVGNGYMVHRPTSDRPVERAWIKDGFWREKFEVGLRLLPPDLPLPGTTANDGKGTPDGPKRVHRARIEAHSGKAAVRVDGQVKPLSRLDAKFSLLGNGRCETQINCNWDADGNQDLEFHQNTQDGTLKQRLLIDGKPVELAEVDMEQHIIPGKSPGFLLDVTFQ